MQDLSAEPRRPRSALALPEVDALWIDAAAEVGFVVERSREVYAASDGRGRILIGVDEILDGDDAVAQLILHELCHAMVEGEAAWKLPDWGLDDDPAQILREHACLRMAAAIADRFGLRAEMAPTTEYRAFYRLLPADALGPAGEPAAADARAAIRWFDASGWRQPLENALAATAALVGRRHPLGFAYGRPAETCGSCAWIYEGGRGTAVTRCRQAASANGDGGRTTPDQRACALWEPPVDCRACGACCREAYHSVTVSLRDPVVFQEPELIVRTGHRFEIRRAGSRCAALVVAQPARATVAETAPRPAYSCSIYDHRPKPCREFASNGRHCLDARRRVGLTVHPR